MAGGGGMIPMRAMATSYPIPASPTFFGGEGRGGVGTGDDGGGGGSAIDFSASIAAFRSVCSSFSSDQESSSKIG